MSDKLKEALDAVAELGRLQGRVISLEAQLESEKAENARLRKGDDRDMTTAYLYGAEQYKAKNARLKAEVERLTEVIKAQAKGLDEKFGREGGQS